MLKGVCYVRVWLLILNVFVVSRILRWFILFMLIFEFVIYKYMKFVGKFSFVLELCWKILNLYLIFILFF